MPAAEMKCGIRQIGIVVLNYQTWKLSLRCMKSVKRACGRYLYRIYLVDNASDSAMPEAVRQYMQSEEDSICFIQAKKNLGYAAGNNLGIEKALEDDCSVIVIANNDIIFCRQSISRMAECLFVHAGVGIAAPKVIGRDGAVQASCCSMRTGIREIFQVYTAARIIFRRKCREYHCLNQKPDKPAYVYHVSGCCFAMSRECAQKVMPMDEGTMLYFEEPILGMRMQHAGFRTRYEPESTVIHEHGATTRRSMYVQYQCISCSEMYYCSRYLKAADWQLWLLYQYRQVLYLFRSITDRDLRQHWADFHSETKRMYYSLRGKQEHKSSNL